MGADGGSIVGRQELVTTKKAAVQLHNPKEVARDQANSCTLSHEPLKAPVVACALGQLYNKTALLEYLLGKQRFPHFSHISGLKDVSPVTLTWSAPASADEQKEASAAVSSKDVSADTAALYSCPLTGLASNGVNRFIALQPCGCVVSERAWKSVSTAKGQAEAACIVCSKLVAADSAGATSTPAAAAASSPSDSAAAPASALAPSAASPFHHPAYLTLFPGPEETLYLRALSAEKLRAKDAEKARAKAAKRAAAAGSAASAAAGDEATAAAASSSSAAAPATSSAVGSHKRKADAQSIAGSPSVLAAASSSAHASKKPHVGSSAGAHAALVNERTGNTISAHVLAITSAAAASVAERKKDANFSGMFLTEAQRAATKYSSISTKPDSLMSRL